MTDSPRLIEVTFSLKQASPDLPQGKNAQCGYTATLAAP